MKRILLLSAAALGVMAMSAEERDVTPKNFIFYNHAANTVDELGITDNEPCGAWNLEAYWWENHVKDVYNEGYLTWGGNQGMAAEKCKAMMDLVNFGGEVGKVLAISTPNSKINEALTAHFGESAPVVTLPTENAGAHEWFWYLDGENYPDRNSGKYLRIRIEMNVFANEMKQGEAIGGNLYINDNANNVHPADDNATANNAISTIESADVVNGEDENGDPVTAYAWNPENWCLMEWYFDLPTADEHTYGAKVKMNLGDEGSLVPYTLLIRRFEVTELEGTCPAAAPHQRTINVISTTETEPGEGENPGEGDTNSITSIENGINAAAEYYNLQGVRVANPENGLYIKKQGKKAEIIRVK